MVQKSKFKKVQCGVLIRTEGKDGNKKLCLGLGKQSTDPKYAVSVELIVRDGAGNVIAKQTDGFVDLVDPRTQPEELLKNGAINQQQYEKMMERVPNIPEKIRYQLNVVRNS